MDMIMKNVLPVTIGNTLANSNPNPNPNPKS